MSDDASSTVSDTDIDLTDTNVITKFRKAGEIANAVCEKVIAAMKPGVRIVEVCQIGDAYILEATANIYNKGKIEKGIAFPTSLSVNHIAGHFSPLSDDTTTFKDGDLVKIDLGVHIDGYPAMIAHTVILGKAEGRRADVLLAAHTAAQATLRLMKPGGTNTEVTNFIEKSAEQFKCTPVVGVLSHQIQRFTLDGERCIISKNDPEQKVDEFQFEPGQVFGIDIVMSTGEGKPLIKDYKTTIYRKSADKRYNLKGKAAKATISQILQKAPSFPFSLRQFEDGLSRFKLGIKECQQHELIQQYPPLVEVEGEFVAHFKFTCLLTQANQIKVTGLPVDVNAISSEHSVTDPALQEVLARSIGKKKRKKKKKKKKAAAVAANPSD